MPKPKPYKPFNSYAFTNEGEYNDIKIKPNDTFNSLFGNVKKSYDDLKALADNPIYKKLAAKYKEIFDAGKDAGLHYGEIQIMINNFSGGRCLHDIEYRLLDDLKLHIHCKADSMLSFINPPLHALLIRTKYFKKDGAEMASKNRTARIARIIKSLSGKPDSRAKLNKFTEILSRL